MHLALNHLTRMHGGNICAAGIDLRTRRHVRPVLPWDQLTTDLLACRGGLLRLGSVLDMLTVPNSAGKPHVEDQVFEPTRTKVVERLDAAGFWDLLSEVSRPTLRAIFGGDLKLIGRSSCGTEVGKGDVSLGCLRPKIRPRLSFQPKGRSGPPRVRLHVTDGEFHLDLAVSDLRFCRDDFSTPDETAVQEIAGRLPRCAEVILGVGLTRPFQHADFDRPFHWVQVTGVFLQCDPLWRA